MSLPIASVTIVKLMSVDTVSEGHIVLVGKRSQLQREISLMSQVLHVIFVRDGFDYCLICPKRLVTASNFTQSGWQWHHLSQFDPSLDVLEPSSPVSQIVMFRAV